VDAGDQERLRSRSQRASKRFGLRVREDEHLLRRRRAGQGIREMVGREVRDCEGNREQSDRIGTLEYRHLHGRCEQPDVVAPTGRPSASGPISAALAAHARRPRPSETAVRHCALTYRPMRMCLAYSCALKGWRNANSRLWLFSRSCLPA
jgi:hypothetical protein